MPPRNTRPYRRLFARLREDSRLLSVAGFADTI